MGQSLKKCDSLKCHYRTVVFVVNTEGIELAGFAQTLSEGCWPELGVRGDREYRLGELLQKEVLGRTLLGIVCHTNRRNGWAAAANIIRDCLKRLPIDSDEEIGFVGLDDTQKKHAGKANTELILEVIAKSSRLITII